MVPLPFDKLSSCPTKCDEITVHMVLKSRYSIIVGNDEPSYSGILYGSVFSTNVFSDAAGISAEGGKLRN